MVFVPLGLSTTYSQVGTIVKLISEVKLIHFSVFPSCANLAA